MSRAAEQNTWKNARAFPVTGFGKDSAGAVGMHPQEDETAAPYPVLLFCES